MDPTDSKDRETGLHDAVPFLRSRVLRGSSAQTKFSPVSGNPNAFSATANAAGMCTVFLADLYGNQATVPVNVTLTKFTINSIDKHK